MGLDNLSLPNVMPILPELILICVALILIILDLVVKKKGIVASAGLVGILISLYVTYKTYSVGGVQTAFAGMFVLDGYSVFFKLIFYLNVILTICISLKYMEIETASFG